MIIPANPGFDALYITTSLSDDSAIGFTACPVIAWSIDTFPQTEDFHVTAIDLDNGPPSYDALRYPDGRVYVTDQWFDSVQDWLSDVHNTRAASKKRDTLGKSS